jgi:hypothetical protein
MRPLIVAFVAIALGQSGNSLNGNWAATFQGTTYVRLAVADSAAGPQGTMSIGQSIHVDQEGNVDQVTQASPTLNRMVDVRWNVSVLSFAINTSGDDERFEFRLTDANHAELTPIISEEQRQELAAERIPLPKPFALARTR